MAKKGRNQKNESRSSKRKSRHDYVDPQDMDDEIDTFHKQRDIVPLDLNGDVDELSEDEEEPVFDLKSTDDEDEDEDDEDDGEDDDPQDNKLLSQMKRTQKFLREKIGNFDDEMHDEEEDKEAMDGISWIGKGNFHGGDNRDVLGLDEETLIEEEEEAIRLHKEQLKKKSEEDFDLVGEDESDKELTLDGFSVQENRAKRIRLSKEAVDDMGTTLRMKKDLNALSREEQIDAVDGSELVDLLSELNKTLEELENKVNPFLNKVKVGGVMLEGGMRYLELKQLLLLSYCQAITFYLLLKTEGQQVRYHPVIDRLVEIKGLLDKVKLLDGNIPSEFHEFLKKNSGLEMVENSERDNDAPALTSDSITQYHDLSLPSADAQEQAEHHDAIELVKTESLTGRDGKVGKRKHKNEEVGVQSMEMLKVRASLEEKLKQKGLFSSFPSKPNKAQKHLKPVNGQLETHEDYDDDDDDAINVQKGNRRLSDGHKSSLGPNRLSKLVMAKQNKPKVISGDDDLPKRDDIGERRRKHELRVLAGAGIKSEVDAGIQSEDDAGDELQTCEADETSDMNEDGDSSDDDLYEQVKQIRAAKHDSKAAIYKRTSAPPSLPETVDGKRQVTYQIEKNRGLTRQRNKLTKNPRKKYRTKHDKAKKRRQGQVRVITKPSGPYGGESTGINARISRSVRL